MAAPRDQESSAEVELSAVLASLAFAPGNEELGTRDEKSRRQ